MNITSLRNTHVMARALIVLQSKNGAQKSWEKRTGLARKPLAQCSDTPRNAPSGIMAEMPHYKKVSTEIYKM